MAFNEFYCDTGGSNVNSGSTTSTTASVTSTNGDWGSVTANRFTPNGGGTPFSTVSVGDWASIYLDGATTLVYIAQVTAVNGGGATLDFSTTAKYGTSPATGATGRSIKIGGAWASPTAFIGTGTTAVYNSTRINIKAGTYPNTTAVVTFNNVGSVTAVLWWRGYNTTPGDIDTNNSLTKPLISWTTGQCTMSGIKQQYAYLNFTSARVAGAAFTMTDEQYFTRCRFENTGVNASASTINCVTTQGPTFNHCYVKSTGTASQVITLSVGTGWTHCTITGGGIGLNGNAGSPGFFYFDHNIILNTSSHGISFSTAVRTHLMYNTFKGCGGDGIRYVLAPTPGNSLRYCLFDGCTGVNINNSSGTNNQTTLFSDNAFFGGSANYAGFGDSPTYNNIQESSSPSIGSTDPTYSSTGFTGASNNQPFENMSVTGTYWDIGATQRQVTTGGGSTEHSHLFVGP